MKPKTHTRAGSSTKHATLRIPDYVMAALESDSAHLGISVNSMSNSILTKWARWDRHIQKLQMVTVPKELISIFIPDDNEKDIYGLVDRIFPFFQDVVILIKGKYDLKRCIETLEDYMQTTGIVSDHTLEGQVHVFTIRHEMGRPWSVFIKAMLGRLFAEFVPDKKVEYEIYTNIITVRIPLGSDWDEHNY